MDLERNLRLQEHTLRFLTVSLGTEFNKEDYMKKLAEQAKRLAEIQAEERAHAHSHSYSKGE